MQSDEIRKEFGEFFRKNSHQEIPSSPLIPENDPSVLLTTAGMQQLKPYMLGLKDSEKDFGSRKLFSIQKSFRTSDIEEVGDETHHTFFEMLGNFSIGDYFKKEAIEFAWNFLIKELKIPQGKLFVTIFAGATSDVAGEKEIPEDTEALKIWKKVAPQVEVKKLGKEDNFWGPTGETGPCGPSSEIHFKNDKGSVELWNLVFMEYNCQKDLGRLGNLGLEKLKQKNIDTGMGLERLTRVLQGKTSAYETDLFTPIMEAIREIREFGVGETSKKQSKEIIRSERIIADHVRGAVFLSADGVIPSNVGRGYILRRLIRRAVLHGHLLEINGRFLAAIIDPVIEKYSAFYPEALDQKPTIITSIQEEEEKFDKTLQNGLKELKKLENKKIISAKEAFDLYQSYGFPLELTVEIASQKGVEVDRSGFAKLLEKHQEVSRSEARIFKGGIAEVSDRTVKMHTATHLLHQALRSVLGSTVAQKGSNITDERLRFDFSYPKSLTEEELKETEDLVNQKINSSIEVKQEIMDLKKAKASGAIGLFEEKYQDKTSVYTIGDFSKEFCGGPHVTNTKEIGRFKILKEEPIASGIRRIRATVF